MVPEDADRYQTIFAKHEGLLLLQRRGYTLAAVPYETYGDKRIDFAVEITLHVGLGNFRTVDVEDLYCWQDGF